MHGWFFLMLTACSLEPIVDDRTRPPDFIDLPTCRYRQSVSHWCFPDDWQRSSIKPLLKPFEMCFEQQTSMDTAAVFIRVRTRNKRAVCATLRTEESMGGRRQALLRCMEDVLARARLETTGHAEGGCEFELLVRFKAAPRGRSSESSGGGEDCIHR